MNLLAFSFITTNQEDSLRGREVRVHNEFPVAVHIAHIDFGPDVETYFEVCSSVVIKLIIDK